MTEMAEEVPVATSTKKHTKKGSRPNPYYTPMTPARRLRQKLEAGDPPGDLLKYSHRRSEYSPEVIEYVKVAEKIANATKLLATLTDGSTGVLNNSVGENLGQENLELVKLIERLKELQPQIDVRIRDHLLSIVPED